MRSASAAFSAEKSSSQVFFDAECQKCAICEKGTCSFFRTVLRYEKIAGEMQGWRRVVGYTADREKELTAESFFQDRYHDTAYAVTKFHAGAAQGKRSCVVVCDVAHVTCRVSDPCRRAQRSGNRVVPRKLFRPRVILTLGFFYFHFSKNKKGESR